MRPRWRGRRESDSQVFCHLDSMHALAFFDKELRHTSRPNHHHHQSSFVQTGCSCPRAIRRKGHWRLAMVDCDGAATARWPWQKRCTTQLQGDRRLPGPRCSQESSRTLGPRRETEHELYAALRGPKPPSPGSWLVRRLRGWTPPLPGSSLPLRFGGRRTRRRGSRSWRMRRSTTSLMPSSTL